MGTLKASTALITGAGRGLGSSLLAAFMGAGYGVIGNRLQSVEGAPCPMICGNIASEATRWALTKAVSNDGLDVLVNNVGVYMSKPFSQITDAELHNLISLNFTASVLLTKSLWLALVKVNGIVVNINSLAGKAGSAGETIYAASKHGMAGFGKILQFDGGRDGVRILDVYIGAMKTDMTRGREDWDKFIDPQEVAEIIVDLCKSRHSLRITDITLMRRNY